MHGQIQERSIRDSSAIQAFSQEIDKVIKPKQYNPGLGTPRAFEFRGNLLLAPAVQVMDRKMFFDLSGDSGVQNYYIMDIVNLRQADMAMNYSGNKSADLLLNNLGRIVVNEVESFNDSSENKRILFCRYGGDEFGFSYQGMTPEEIRNFNQKIKTLLNETKGVFRPSMEVDLLEERNIDVEFKDHSRPKDGLGQAIFDHFRDNSVLLNAEEVAKLKNKFNNDYLQFRLWRVIQDVGDFYPKEVVTAGQKLRYLARVNPLLESGIIRLIEMAEGLKEGAEIAKFKLQMELQKLLVDPLLKRPTISRGEMIQNIKSGNVSHIWTKDMKFMKELNNVSYADGDNAIKTLWQAVEECIEPADMDKLIISRDGGTLVMGLRVGEVLSQKTVTRLRKLEKVRYKGIASDDKIDIVIGTSEHAVNPEILKKRYGLRNDLSRDEEFDSKRLMNEEIKQAFNVSDDVFYQKLAVKLMTPMGLDNGAITSTYWDTVFSTERPQGLSTINLIHDYFISKRASQRLTQLEKAIDTLDTSSLLSRYLTTGAQEAWSLNNLTSKQQIMLKRVREAMNYAYSHSILEAKDLKKVHDILRGIGE
jgi:GGDEF domain-containing protein